jgi:hypothetical protein
LRLPGFIFEQRRGIIDNKEVLMLPASIGPGLSRKKTVMSDDFLMESLNQYIILVR